MTDKPFNLTPARKALLRNVANVNAKDRAYPWSVTCAKLSAAEYLTHLIGWPSETGYWITAKGRAALEEKG